MLDEIDLPIKRAAKWHAFAQSSSFLKEIINHPHLNEEEKYLWLWLACHAHNPSFSCSYTYEQIAIAMKKPPQLVHRILFRLVITGFISSADIPIWYGALTIDMVKALRHIKLVLPPKPILDPDKKGVVLPRGHKLEETKSTSLAFTAANNHHNSKNRSQKKKQKILFSILFLVIRGIKKYIKFINDCRSYRFVKY